MANDIKKAYSNIAKLGKITTPYGGSTRSEKDHLGIDIANKNGTPIKSNTNGRVVGVSKNAYDFGNSLMIKDNKGNIHRYSHLKDMFVKKGDPVVKGAHIANMGDTGNSYSPSGGDSSHLDYRTTNSKGKNINPTKFFK